MFTPVKRHYGYGWTMRKRFDDDSRGTAGHFPGFSVTSFAFRRITCLSLFCPTPVRRWFPLSHGVGANRPWRKICSAEGEIAQFWGTCNLLQRMTMMWVAAQILALAVSYYLTGQLGLLLAIPPGYAMAILAGVRHCLAAVLLFGYRVWPGIVLGSLLINVPTSWDSSTPTKLLIVLALPLGISVGAAAQVIVGASSVRRYVGFPNPLNRERLVTMFLVLAGPVNCLINATVGVTLLWWTDQIRRRSIRIVGGHGGSATRSGRSW